MHQKAGDRKRLSVIYPDCRGTFPECKGLKPGQIVETCKGCPHFDEEGYLNSVMNKDENVVKEDLLRVFGVDLGSRYFRHLLWAKEEAKKISERPVLSEEEKAKRKAERDAQEKITKEQRLAELQAKGIDNLSPGEKAWLARLGIIPKQTKTYSGVDNANRNERIAYLLSKAPQTLTAGEKAAITGFRRKGLIK